MDGLSWAVSVALASMQLGLVDQQATGFDLPEPATAELEPVSVWSTNYVLHRAREVAEGHPLLGPGDTPFPASDPVHLTAKDWCMAALQGSARIRRLDGSVLTVTYASEGEVAVDCGPPLGNSKWRTQGRVRFGPSRGAFGDGVSGYELVPYRTIATDPAVIPTGSAVYLPSARGVEVRVGGRTVVHDGWFFAADVGGAIRGVHIDTFTGTHRRHGLPHVTNRADKRVDAYVIDDPDIVASLRRLHD